MDVSKRSNIYIFQKVVQDVAYLWRRMSNPRDKDVRITHDGYLKVYQLSKPTITGFDCLLIDEAQDCTPGMITCTCR